MKPLWLIAMVTVSFAFAGCAPEVGSEKWCEALKEKPKGDWTANELKDFTANCLFKKDND
jgi:hypothetical protein